MKQEEPTVYIVDDDLSMREALSSLIRSIGLHAIAFSSAREFLRQQLPAGAACLVLDVRMPGMSGLELHRRLEKSGQLIPIIFITAHGDIPMAVRAMKAGAVEFFPKPFRDEDLLDAIRIALNQDSLARRERAELDEIRSRFHTLTVREQEVIRLIISGALNKQVANQLGITEITVKVHRHNIMRKMDARSLVQLAEMVERLGEQRK